MRKEARKEAFDYPTFCKRAAAANRKIAQRRQIEPAAARKRRRHTVRHAWVLAIFSGEGASSHRAAGSGRVSLVQATSRPEFQ